MANAYLRERLATSQASSWALAPGRAYQQERIAPACKVITNPGASKVNVVIVIVWLLD
jgi:hypothetical protein